MTTNNGPTCISVINLKGGVGKGLACSTVRQWRLTAYLNHRCGAVAPVLRVFPVATLWCCASSIV